jgi:signal transduction histidine kinase
MVFNLLKKYYFVTIILLIIIIVHFVMLNYYFQKYDPIANPVVESNAIYSYVSELQYILDDKSPELINIQVSKFMNASTLLNRYPIKISFSPKPKNTITFSGKKALSNLSIYLKDQIADEFNFSFQLHNGNWVNINPDVPYFFYITLCLLFIADLIIAGSFAIYLWTTWRFAAPLQRFKQSAEQIGIDLNATPPNIKTGPILVRETAEAISRMRTRISHLIDTRTQLLAKLSHDLRSPITQLKLHAQFIPISDHTEKINLICDEMEEMIASIVDFSAVEGLHENKIKLDITALLNSICEDYMDLDYPIRFASDKKRILIYGRMMALKRAITNLIQNALKYGKRAEVKLRQSDKNHIAIIIDDEGPGIPEDDLEKVFKIYYRVQNASNNTPGNGLGLAIAYEIISAHDGTIEIKNIQPNGLQVIINLPLRMSD